MNTREPSVTPLAATVSNPERTFPALTPPQVSRIAAHGQRRQTAPGEVLFEAGDRGVPVFVVLTGELQVLRPTDTGETVIVSYHRGQFSAKATCSPGAARSRDCAWPRLAR